MDTPPKSPPRFLPTLTEVVRPDELGGALAAPGAGMPAHQAAGLQQEQLVREVMRRLNSSLEVRLREAIGTVVVEQVQLLAPRLRQEIEMVVRQVVADALGSEEPMA
jgi:hypothetical protein